MNFDDAEDIFGDENTFPEPEFLTPLQSPVKPQHRQPLSPIKLNLNSSKSETPQKSILKQSSIENLINFTPKIPFSNKHVSFVTPAKPQFAAPLGYTGENQPPSDPIVTATDLVALDNQPLDNQPLDNQPLDNQPDKAALCDTVEQQAHPEPHVSEPIPGVPYPAQDVKTEEPPPGTEPTSQPTQPEVAPSPTENDLSPPETQTTPSEAETDQKPATTEEGNNAKDVNSQEKVVPVPVEEDVVPEEPGKESEKVVPEVAIPEESKVTQEVPEQAAAEKVVQEEKGQEEEVPEPKDTDTLGAVQTDTDLLFDIGIPVSEEGQNITPLVSDKEDSAPKPELLDTFVDAAEFPAESEKKDPSAEPLPLSVDIPDPSAKMEEPEAASPPLPVAKGSYVIDWDNFDENTNPFETKSKVVMGQSPPIRGPPATNSNEEDIDPFKPRTKVMANSPPGSPKQNRTVSDENENIKTAENDLSPTDSLEMDKMEVNDNKENEVKEVKKPPPKKTLKKKPTGPSAKRIPKKFKPPANFGKGLSDDIVIFAPGEKPSPAHSDNTPSESSSVETISDHNQPTTATEPQAAAVPPGDLDGLVNNHFTDMPPPLSTAVPHAPADLFVNPMDDLFVNPMKGLEEFQEEEFVSGGSEMFNDPAAFDMLEKFGGSKNDKSSALTRQSLYVKFDPLVNADSPVKPAGKGPLAAIAQSDDLLLMGTPPSDNMKNKHPAARALDDAFGYQNDEKSSGSSQSQKDLDRVFAFSPQLYNGEGESGKAMSPPPRPTDNFIGDSADIIQVLKYSQADVNRMRKEWELTYQANFLSKERDWVEKYKEQDNKVDSKELEKDKLNKVIDGLRLSVQEHETVAAEYQRALAQMTVDSQTTSTDNQDSLQDLVKERDQALDDLQSVENAFSDLHRRYEKTKSSLEWYKKNEDTLKGKLAEMQTKIKKQEERYQALKVQAEEKVEKASEEVDKVERNSQSEIARLQMAVRKSELQVSSLEQSIEQKTNENKELTAICDELINKVGPK